VVVVVVVVVGGGGGGRERERVMPWDPRSAVLYDHEP